MMVLDDNDNDDDDDDGVQIGNDDDLVFCPTHHHILHQQLR